MIKLCSGLLKGNVRNSGKGAFSGNIWWSDLRPIHGCIYLLFALLAIKKNKNAWIVLLADAMVGLSAFLLYKKI